MKLNKEIKYVLTKDHRIITPDFNSQVGKWKYKIKLIIGT